MKTTKEQRGIWSKVGSSDIQDLCEDVDTLTKALEEAAASLATLSNAGARGANLEDMNYIRCYAASRARVAREVLEALNENIGNTKTNP